MKDFCLHICINKLTSNHLYLVIYYLYSFFVTQKVSIILRIFFVSLSKPLIKGIQVMTIHFTFTLKNLLGPTLSIMSFFKTVGWRLRKHIYAPSPIHCPSFCVLYWDFSSIIFSTCYKFLSLFLHALLYICH